MMQGTGMGCLISGCRDNLIVNRANLFNYINLSHPDTSGMLRFLTDELQDAEDSGDRGMSLVAPYASTDILHQFGSWVMFPAALMGQMHWRHRVISVRDATITHCYDKLTFS